MRGFTLIELIIALAILCAFLGLGIPKIHALAERYETNNRIVALYNTLTHARSLAKSRSLHITACPSRQSICSGDWSNPVIVFNDQDLNNQLDENEELFFRTHLETNYGYWVKSKAIQPYVRFDTSGYAFSSASTFLFCPYSLQYQLAKTIVINFQGRTRIGDYVNKEGKPYSKYRHLSCQ